MDNQNKISNYTKKINALESKQISEQIKQLLVQELKKKKNKKNKQMNRKQLLHKKTN